MGEFLGYLGGEIIQARKKSSSLRNQNPTALNSELEKYRYLHTSAFKLHEKMTYPYFIKFFIN